MFQSDENQAEYLKSRKFGVQPAPHHPDGERLAIDHTNNLYDGEVRFLDEQIRALLERLRADADSWSHTALVVVGDHGEGLAQHNEMNHGGVWNEQLQVPLLMRVPGQDPRRVTNLLSVVDVVPTLLSFVELPGEEHLLLNASGVDRLRPSPDPVLVLSQEPNAPWKVSDEEPIPSYVGNCEDWKLIYDPDRENRLYRLSTDPFELQDVRAEHPDIAERLEGRILETIGEHQARGLVLQSEDAIPLEDVDPERLEELRALGYID
jgi:arylsulfatase A-like enzyme